MNLSNDTPTGSYVGGSDAELTRPPIRFANANGSSVRRTKSILRQTLGKYESSDAGTGVVAAVQNKLNSSADESSVSSFQMAPPSTKRRSEFRREHRRSRSAADKYVLKPHTSTDPAVTDPITATRDDTGHALLSYNDRQTPTAAITRRSVLSPRRIDVEPAAETSVFRSKHVPRESLMSMEMEETLAVNGSHLQDNDAAPADLASAHISVGDFNLLSLRFLDPELESSFEEYASKRNDPAAWKLTTIACLLYILPFFVLYAFENPINILRYINLTAFSAPIYAMIIIRYTTAWLHRPYVTQIALLSILILLLTSQNWNSFVTGSNQSVIVITTVCLGICVVPNTHIRFPFQAFVIGVNLVQRYLCTILLRTIYSQIPDLNIGGTVRAPFDTSTLSTVGHEFVIGFVSLAILGITWQLERQERREFWNRKLLSETVDNNNILLQRMLPTKIIHKLQMGQRVIADNYDSCTILFADIESFHTIVSTQSPINVVHLLDKVFNRFDELLELYGVYKVETVFDTYMAVCGLPDVVTDATEHAVRCGQLALAMIQVGKELEVEILRNIHDWMSVEPAETRAVTAAHPALLRTNSNLASTPQARMHRRRSSRGATLKDNIMLRQNTNRSTFNPLRQPSIVGTPPRTLAALSRTTTLFNNRSTFIPTPSSQQHAEQPGLATRAKLTNFRLAIRVGLHSGPVVAGVIGRKLPRYRLFGDTVNTAARMCSHGKGGRVQCSGETQALLERSPACNNVYSIVDSAVRTIKGKGHMQTAYLSVPLQNYHSSHDNPHTSTDTAPTNTALESLIRPTRLSDAQPAESLSHPLASAPASDSSSDGLRSLQQRLNQPMIATLPRLSIAIDTAKSLSSITSSNLPHLQSVYGTKPQTQTLALPGLGLTSKRHTPTPSFTDLLRRTAMLENPNVYDPLALAHGVIGSKESGPSSSRTKTHRTLSSFIGGSAPPSPPSATAEPLRLVQRGRLGRPAAAPTSPQKAKGLSGAYVSMDLHRPQHRSTRSDGMMPPLAGSAVMRQAANTYADGDADPLPTPPVQPVRFDTPKSPHSLSAHRRALTSLDLTQSIRLPSASAHQWKPSDIVHEEEIHQTVTDSHHVIQIDSSDNLITAPLKQQPLSQLPHVQSFHSKRDVPSTTHNSPSAMTPATITGHRGHHVRAQSSLGDNLAFAVRISPPYDPQRQTLSTDTDGGSQKYRSSSNKHGFASSSPPLAAVAAEAVNTVMSDRMLPAAITEEALTDSSYERTDHEHNGGPEHALPPALPRAVSVSADAERPTTAGGALQLPLDVSTADRSISAPGSLRARKSSVATMSGKMVSITTSGDDVSAGASSSPVDSTLSSIRAPLHGEAAITITPDTQVNGIDPVKPMQARLTIDTQQLVLPVRSSESTSSPTSISRSLEVTPRLPANSLSPADTPTDAGANSDDPNASHHTKQRRHTARAKRLTRSNTSYKNAAHLTAEIELVKIRNEAKKQRAEARLTSGSGTDGDSDVGAAMQRTVTGQATTVEKQATFKTQPSGFKTANSRSSIVNGLASVPPSPSAPAAAAGIATANVDEDLPFQFLDPDSIRMERSLSLKFVDYPQLESQFQHRERRRMTTSVLRRLHWALTAFSILNLVDLLARLNSSDETQSAVLQRVAIRWFGALIPGLMVSMLPKTDAWVTRVITRQQRKAVVLTPNNASEPMLLQSVLHSSIVQTVIHWSTMEVTWCITLALLLMTVSMVFSDFDLSSPTVGSFVWVMLIACISSVTFKLPFRHAVCFLGMLILSYVLTFTVPAAYDPQATDSEVNGAVFYPMIMVCVALLFLTKAWLIEQHARVRFITLLGIKKQRKDTGVLLRRLLPKDCVDQLLNVKPQQVSVNQPQVSQTKNIDESVIQMRSHDSQVDLMGDLPNAITDPAARALRRGSSRSKLGIYVRSNSTRRLALAPAAEGEGNGSSAVTLLGQAQYNTSIPQQPSYIAEYFPAVTMMQADICSFTPLCARSTPHEIIALLNELFIQFDALTDQFGVYKVETIGDAYLACSGAPTPHVDHAQHMADMALAARETVRQFRCPHDQSQIEMRFGVHSGAAVGGVVGTLKMPRYHVFGLTVSVAGKIEASSEPMSINVSETTRNLLNDDYDTQWKGVVTIDSEGTALNRYELLGRRKAVVKDDDFDHSERERERANRRSHRRMRSQSRASALSNSMIQHPPAEQMIAPVVQAVRVDTTTPPVYISPAATAHPSYIDSPSAARLTGSKDKDEYISSHPTKPKRTLTRANTAAMQLESMM